MKPSILLLGALAASSEQRQVPPGAGLAGPAFVAPCSLQRSGILKSAINDFDESISNSGPIQLDDSAWAVAVFSKSDNEPLYEKYFTPNYTIGVPEVTRDSVFRIASASKVFSVWTFLKEVGDEHFGDPITKYVPELANLSHTSEPGVVYDDIDDVRWDEVTLGQLASHQAGIPRDPSATELSIGMTSEQLNAYGLPVLNETELPVCGVSGKLRTCNRSETISQLLLQHPIFPTAHSPAYSNIAYTLLGYAQEAITGVPVSEAIKNNIFDFLNMTSSSFSTAPATGGVIPGGNPGGNASLIGWDTDLGPSAPSGSIYSSTADMIKAGRAIFNSDTLTPAQTRRWLKPMSQTGVLGSAVGAPWEIRYLMLNNTSTTNSSTNVNSSVVGQRLAQIYTKQGDLGEYRAAFILSPEHDIGAIIFSAGKMKSNSSAVREELMNAVGRIFVPMAERQARIEAEGNFAGKYMDEATNSSVTISVDEGVSGLVVQKLVSRGVEVIGPNSPFIQGYGAGQSARLFPTTLKTVRERNGGNGTFTSRMGFRASFFNATGDLNDVQDPGLMQWTSLGAPTYGSRTLDDWVFEMGEDGKAELVDIRMLRVKMGHIVN